MEYDIVLGGVPHEPWNEEEPIIMNAETVEELSNKMKEYLIENKTRPNDCRDFGDEKPIIWMEVFKNEADFVCTITFEREKGKEYILSDPIISYER